jgi:hypothetical protein
LLESLLDSVGFIIIIITIIDGVTVTITTPLLQLLLLLLLRLTLYKVLYSKYLLVHSNFIHCLFGFMYNGDT